MKPILYFSAALMIGASIYGFVDYKKTTRIANFKNMYDKKEVTNSAIASKKENVVKMPEPPGNTKVVTPGKSIEKGKPMTKKTTTKKSVRSIAEKSNLKKQKKLDHKLFSRAPLREYPEIKEIPTN